MPINIGTVCFLRTTEEPCFILDIAREEAPNFPGLEGEVAIVRRPVAGENGVSHAVDTFYTEELLSKEEYMQGRKSGFMDMFGQAVGQAGENVAEPIASKDAN